MEVVIAGGRRMSIGEGGAVRDAAQAAADAADRPPTCLLFLLADTGGGHRAAGRAVAEALQRRYRDRFTAVFCDPLAGPGTPWLLRRLVDLYGPAVRWVPRLWGIAFHATNTRLGLSLLRAVLRRYTDAAVAAAVAAHRPAAIVSLHPLTGWSAVRAGRPGGSGPPVVTVVTDLVCPHLAWGDADADRVVLPPSAAGRLGSRAGRSAEIGVPVGAAFAAGPLSSTERPALRRSLGLDEDRFIVVFAGGAEGAGGMARRVAATIRRLDGVAVVALCGRNRRLQATLTRLAGRSAGRLTVRGPVDNMADWLHCADLVVSKAGPATIAEAACCAAPLLLTSYLPGQENGNVGLVVDAGAGRYVPGVRQLVREMARLRRDPSAVSAMRRASARLARPGAADEIATLLAEVLGGPG